MTKSLQNLRPIPLAGPLTAENLNAWWARMQQYAFAPQDFRNPNQAALYGRTVQIPTLFTYVGDTGRAASTRFMYPVSTANRSSVQGASGILTAVSGASISSISISAHTLKFDFGTVSYGSGSVAGLSTSTHYYVYGSDPNYAGGAITYLATTNTANLIAAGTYFVGEIDTPVSGSSSTVSAASLANPTSITTSANHGWSTGNTVTFATMTGGFTALNGNNYVITVTSVTTFTIPVDATAFGAYAGGGIATRVTSSSSGGGGGGAGGGGNPWR